MIAEAVGGYISNSIAVMSDAAHLLSDLLSFFVGIFALKLASKGARTFLPFGYHRAEVLGALVSILIVWILTVVLLYEAIDRFIHPPKEFDAKVMMGTAALGILVNILMGYSLHQGTHKHFHTHLDGTRCSGNHGHSQTEHMHGPGCSHDHDHEVHSHHHKQAHHDHDGCCDHDHHEPQKHEHHAHSGACNHGHDHHHGHQHDHQHGSHIETADTTQESSAFEMVSTTGIRKHSDDDVLSAAKPKKHHVAHSQKSHSHTKHGHDHHDHKPPTLAVAEFILPSRNHNVNVRAAYAHIVGDLIQSIGVFLISVVIYCYPEWTLFDPICTLIFSVIVVFTTVPVARDCAFVLMEGTDPSLKGELSEKVSSDLEEIHSVTAVRHLRIWNICEGKKAMQVTLLSTSAETKSVIEQAKAIAVKNSIQDSKEQQTKLIFSFGSSKCRRLK